MTNGVITFDDAATFGAALTLGSLSNVAAVVQYLQNNDIGAASTTLAFTATLSGTPHIFVYEQIGNTPSATNGCEDATLSECLRYLRPLRFR